MLNYVLKPTKHGSFYKKYAGKKYLKFHPLTTSALLATHDPTLYSSVWVCKWTLERWAGGTQVAPAEELPMLKAQIRAARAAAPPMD